MIMVYYECGILWMCTMSVDYYECGLLWMWYTMRVGFYEWRLCMSVDYYRVWTTMSVDNYECGLLWVWYIEFELLCARTTMSVDYYECGLLWVWTTMSVVYYEFGLVCGLENPPQCPDVNPLSSESQFYSVHWTEHIVIRFA